MVCLKITIIFFVVFKTWTSIKISANFWFYTGHKQQCTGWKSCVCLKPSVDPTSLLFRLRQSRIRNVFAIRQKQTKISFVQNIMHNAGSLYGSVIFRERMVKVLPFLKCSLSSTVGKPQTSSHRVFQREDKFGQRKKTCERNDRDGI